MQDYLSQTRFLNYEHPAFDYFTASIDSNKNQTDLAVDLYYLVRDSFLYDPYHLDLTYEGLKASNVFLKQRAWCVEKASILAACARKFGIPSQLGYAVVTNHIGTEKLTSYLKRKEIVFHGFVSLFLDDTWVKCTPAFDRRMCAVSGVSPLDWDGKTDSLFQEFEKGNCFMEYMHFYGLFDDVPIELMNQEMQRYYPHLFEQAYDSKQFSFRHLNLTEME